MLCGVEASDLLGRPLSETLPAWAEAISAVAPGLAEGANRSTKVATPPDAPKLWLTVYAWKNRTLVEVEEESGTAERGKRFHDDFLSTIKACDYTAEIGQMACERIKEITNYDRVMCYRFRDDFSGEIVAETRRVEAIPFIGLNYPASDIPAQARALYLASKLRVIADVNCVPISLLGLDAKDGAEIDIGITQLRAMSPFHIEYLKNMGVGASLAASIIIDGKLWGLFACHHDSRKLAPPAVRDDVWECVEATTAQIKTVLQNHKQWAEELGERRAAKIASNIRTGERPLSALLFDSESLAASVSAEGWALFAHDAIITTGRTPLMKDCMALAKQILKKGGEGTVTSSRNLGEDFDLPAKRAQGCCGMISLMVTTDPLLLIVGFSGELAEEVQWGGNPEKPIIQDPKSLRLSPRKSFDLWRSLVRGRSRAWRDQDIAVFNSLALHANGLRDQFRDIDKQIERLQEDYRERHLIAEAILSQIGDGAELLVDELGDGTLTLDYANSRLSDLLEADITTLRSIPLEQFLSDNKLPERIISLPPGDSIDTEIWSEARG